MNHRCVALGIATLILVAAGRDARAQSNVVPGQDVALSAMSSLRVLGRVGTYPDGVNGLAIATTSCNPGTVKIPWFAPEGDPMDARHPFICPLLVRELDGRFEQISDRSYVKHGFFATNLNDCGNCQFPGSGHFLGLNCSDTYSTSNNGDNYYLGEPDEIDPWLGIWNPFCSQFDRGEPPVAPPNDCDGKRSLTQTQSDNLGPVGHRIHVLDVDFDHPDAVFYFQGMYLIAGEAESLRDNNYGSRLFNPTFNGTRWSVTVPSTDNPLTYGTILQRWSGATITSTTNGGDDGRVFVGVKVTGPDKGLYHYEYAVHNRDNARGVGTFRIPACPSARVLNLHFHDVDQDAANDWTVSKSSNEIVFETIANPLLWNSIYNFSFDSDAAPLNGAIQMDQFNPGTGGPMLTVDAASPLEVDNLYSGDGCGVPAVPNLYATGTPNKAFLGNTTFGLQMIGNEPLSPSYLLASLFPATTPLGPGCNLYMSPSGIIVLGVFLSDPTGVLTIPAPIPNDPLLEGLTVPIQCVEVSPTGALWGQYNLSNGIAVRIGSSVSSCP